MLTPAILLGLALAGADAPKADPESAGPIKITERTKNIPGGAKARGRGTGVTTFTSLADLEKAFGKEGAARLAKQVKFPGEVAARIAYEVGGPPFPDLQHTIDKKKREVV